MSVLSDLATYLRDRIPAVEGRIYAQLARQGDPPPFIVYQEDSTDPAYELSGEAGYCETYATYTAWSDDYAQCEELVDDLRLVLTAVVDRIVASTLIDCILIEPSEADTIEIKDGMPTGLQSKTVRFFIRSFRTAATVPGV